MSESAANSSESRLAPTRRFAPIVLGSLSIAVLIAAAGGLWLRSELMASLPQLDGDRSLEGLYQPVQVERDARGVPTLRGSSRADLARALGFLHAQDRFFQMDLLRRRAAGELSEIFGGVTLSADREIRVHRLRAVAKRVEQEASTEDRALVEAYAAGVNAGLKALRAKPFEYLVLGADPSPWLPEDSILTVLAMFVQLHDSVGRRESNLGVMSDLLPPELFTFLAPAGTEWDAPLVGEPVHSGPIPGPHVLDLRTEGDVIVPDVQLSRSDEMEQPEILGSNNWAVSGNYTADHRALVANDMHLALSVPNTWYRATLIWRSPGDPEEHWISGVTLPGTPAVTVGSNRHIAWAFTNSQGDWSDLIVLEPDGTDPDGYQTPDGVQRLQRDRERIRVKGASDETVEVVSTIWGPIIDKDHRGRSRVLHWTAHEKEAVNGGLRSLENARTLEDAIEIAHRAGTPPQNFVCADAEGRIGWTLSGLIPRRVGSSGRLPTSWADGARRWDGWLRSEEYPRIVSPDSGRLWTANARTVDGEMLARLGDGGYANGARARQIRDALLSIDRATPRDMLRIQLDDRALFLSRWRDLMSQALTENALAGHPIRRELKRYVDDWGGHASIDSVGYRAVRTFREQMEQQVFGALTARCAAADPRFNYVRTVSQREGPLWRLVSERPLHLLNPKFASWDEQILSAIDGAGDSLRQAGPLARRTWGERNTARIQHPLSRAMPALRRFLDMPSEPLPGDADMPRVQTPDHGASERLVVSPGNERDGLIHMPGGPSGHPLSPFYRSGHSDWSRGEPTPFLPGPPAHTMTLRPMR